MNENNTKEVESLYKKSSTNLFLISGLFFLLVNSGINELFKLMPDKGYAGGELVVLMISGAKMFTMFLGNNGAIINNSSFYRISLPINVGMAVSVYFLNVWLFEVFGTDGLALATLLVIFTFNSIKLTIVKSKLSISPVTDKTFKIFSLIAVLFFGFYFWDFNFHPLINIVLKSAIIFVLYVIVAVKFKLSQEINNLISRFIKI